MEPVAMEQNCGSGYLFQIQRLFAAGEWHGPASQKMILLDPDPHAVHKADVYSIVYYYRSPIRLALLHQV